jgi:hypothetical protein
MPLRKMLAIVVSDTRVTGFTYSFQYLAIKTLEPGL